MARISQRLNIGERSSQWLEAVGIKTLAQLGRAGSVKAYLKTRKAGFPVSLNLLWALEGALTDRPWFSFSPEEKARLKNELERLRGH